MSMFNWLGRLKGQGSKVELRQQAKADAAFWEAMQRKHEAAARAEKKSKKNKRAGK